MQWDLTLDWKASPLPPRGKLRATLEAASPATASLTVGRPRAVPWYERAIYRTLGLRLVSATPKGGLHAQFAGDLALLAYAVDDEDGLVATQLGGTGGREQVEFHLPNGERVREPRAHCVSRALALDLLEQFYASGERPVGVVWCRRDQSRGA